MTRMDDYRGRAADALYLAHRAPNASDKERLLYLAEKWLALADRAAARALTCRWPRLEPVTAGHLLPL